VHARLQVSVSSDYNLLTSRHADRQTAFDQLMKNMTVIRRRCISPNDFWIETRICGDDNRIKTQECG